MEGVCLLVGPVDKNSWGADDVRKRRLGIKRDSLDKADAKSKSGKDTGDDDKVWDQWRASTVVLYMRQIAPDLRVCSCACVCMHMRVRTYVCVYVCARVKESKLAPNITADGKSSSPQTKENNERPEP